MELYEISTVSGISLNAFFIHDANNQKVCMHSGSVNLEVFIQATGNVPVNQDIHFLYSPLFSYYLPPFFSIVTVAQWIQ